MPFGKLSSMLDYLPGEWRISIRCCCALICIALLFPGAVMVGLCAVSVQAPPQQSSSSSSSSSASTQERPRRALDSSHQQGEPEEILRVDTDLVLVDTTVTDAQGRPVRSLRPTDFKVYEDGAERPISFFNIEEKQGVQRPVAVVFAVDVSGSMTGEEILRLRDAMPVFTERLAERSSSFAVMSFGMNVKTVQRFTNDVRKLDRAFERLARDLNGLSTHTYDAVDDAIRLLVRDAPRTRERRLVKRAVIVVTDGFPVGDTIFPRTVIERANSADVSIYTITLPSYSRLLTAANVRYTPLPTPLDVSGLAEKTGGSNIYAIDNNFEPLFRQLAEEVSSTYVLAFYPSEEKRRDGRFHSIRIEVPNGFHVRQSRPGYKY